MPIYPFNLQIEPIYIFIYPPPPIITKTPLWRSTHMNEITSHAEKGSKGKGALVLPDSSYQVEMYLSRLLKVRASMAMGGTKRILRVYRLRLRALG